MDRGGEFLRGGGVGRGGEGASRQGEEDPGVDGETGLRGALRVTSESAGNGGGGGSTPAATATIEAGQSRRGGRAADRQGSTGQEVAPKRAIVAVVGGVAQVGIPRERGRRGIAVGRTAGGKVRISHKEGRRRRRQRRVLTEAEIGRSRMRGFQAQDGTKAGKGHRHKSRVIGVNPEQSGVIVEEDEAEVAGGGKMGRHRRARPSPAVRGPAPPLPIGVGHHVITEREMDAEVEGPRGGA